MDRRQFVSGLGAAALAAHSGRAAMPPNLVFFLVDDLGWRDLSGFGSSFYDTPNLDRLMRRGVAFTQAYAACPVCSPTRASILTGKYPARTGVTDWIGAAQPNNWTRNTRLLPAPYADRLSLDEVTLAEAFRAGGYATMFAGKWHLGPEGWWPEDQGFDINRGGTGAGSPSPPGRYFVPYGNPRLSDGPPGEHLPARLSREVAEFLTAQRHRPCFCYLSFYSVHTPLMARADLQAKYEAKAQTVDPSLPRWGREGERQVRLIQDHAVYAGMVEAMDQAVGTVVDAVTRLGQLDRTIFVFMSDNGGLSTSEGHPTSNQPLRAGKGWLYEGGVREPMFIVAPGLSAPGGTCDTPVSSCDFYPTLLALAGLPARPAQHLDGVSLAPLLRGGGLPERPLFWHYPHYGNQGGAPAGAVRLGDWKLIEWYETGKLELFNVRDDIGEVFDRSRREPARTRALAERLAAWRTEVGARMPAPNPSWKPAG